MSQRDRQDALDLETVPEDEWPELLEGLLAPYSRIIGHHTQFSKKPVGDWQQVALTPYGTGHVIDIIHGHKPHHPTMLGVVISKFGTDQQHMQLHVPDIMDELFHKKGNYLDVRIRVYAEPALWWTDYVLSFMYDVWDLTQGPREIGVPATVPATITGAIRGPMSIKKANGDSVSNLKPIKLDRGTVLPIEEK